MAVADDTLQLRDRLRDECGGRPVALAAADAIQEIPEHFRAARRVHDLGVELHGEAVAPVAHRRERETLGRRDTVESGRKAFHRVAVAHPRALARAEALEQAGWIGDLDRCGTVLALALRRDLAAEDLRHEM